MVLDLLSIGDVTEDVLVQIQQAHIHQDKGKLLPDLCLPFGTKIGIERVDKLLGGNAGNVAIGAARLGLSSALYAEVGADEIGDSLRHSLQENKVSTKYFYRKKNQKSNYSVILNYHGERTILVHHEPRNYHFPKVEKTKWVYLTSLGHGWETVIPPIVRYLHASPAQLAFNPGTHQLSLGLKRLHPLLRQTAILFVNLEEAELLLREKKSSPKHLLSWLHQQGPKIVVITDGEQGSYTFDGTSYYYCPIYHVTPVERTGCGDAYAAGFLCALFYGKTLPEAMKWGTINSASVLQQIGPQAGLMKLSLMKKVMAANTGFRAQELGGMQKKGYVPKKYTSFIHSKL